MKREDKKRPVIIPYIRIFSKEVKRTFGGYGIPTYFKLTNTLHQLYVHPKDPVRKDKDVGPVYKIAVRGKKAVRNVKPLRLGKPNVH